MSIELGKFNQLEVVKEVDFGLYLDGGDEGEILLPTRYVPEDCKVEMCIRDRSTYVIYWVHVREPNGPRTWNEYMKRTKYISQTLLAC